MLILMRLAVRRACAGNQPEILLDAGHAFASEAIGRAG